MRSVRWSRVDISVVVLHSKFHFFLRSKFHNVICRLNFQSNFKLVVRLLVPVMLDVMLAGLGRVVGSMQTVTMSALGVMGGFLMVTGFVMLGCLMVMPSSRFVMLSRFSMVLCVGVFTR